MYYSVAVYSHINVTESSSKLNVSASAEMTATDAMVIAQGIGLLEQGNRGKGYLHT